MVEALRASVRNVALIRVILLLILGLEAIDLAREPLVLPPQHVEGLLHLLLPPRGHWIVSEGSPDVLLEDLHPLCCALGAQQLHEQLVGLARPRGVYRGHVTLTRTADGLAGT